MKVTDSRPDPARLASRRQRCGGGRDDLVGREFGLVGKAGEWVSECGGKEEEEEEEVDGCGELLAPLRRRRLVRSQVLLLLLFSYQPRATKEGGSGGGGGGRLGDTFHNPRLIVSRIRTTKAFRPSEREGGRAGCDSV